MGGGDAMYAALDAGIRAAQASHPLACFGRVSVRVQATGANTSKSLNTSPTLYTLSKS